MTTPKSRPTPKLLRFAIRAIAITLLLIGLAPQPALGGSEQAGVTARAGDIDYSFGKDGVVFTGITSDEDADPHIVIQPDGKIVLAGHCGDPDLFCVVRYTVDGELDTANFNKPNGFAAFDITGDDDSARDVALQSDGDIVVVGDCDNPQKICIVVLNPDGTLDTTFNPGGGTPGILTTDYVVGDEAESVAILGNDKILVAGECNFNDYYCIGRYNTDGTRDTTFNAAGFIPGMNFVDPTPDFDDDPEVVVQPDGKILLVGACDDYEAICSARFNADGTQDTSWGSAPDYIVYTDLTIWEDIPYQVINAGDGNTLVVASCKTETYFCLIKYDYDGDLDKSFGENKGYVLTKVHRNWNAGRGIVRQSNGRILVTGECGFWENFCVLRYLSDGRLDETFGEDGVVLTDLKTPTDEAESIALQGSKIVVAGECDYNNEFCLVRYFASDQHGVTWFNTGVSGGLYKRFGLYVDIPAEAIPPGPDADHDVCRLFIEEAGEASTFGFKLDGYVYDIHIKCGKTVLTELLQPITICIPPKADGVTSGKQIFHDHGAGNGFEPLYVVDARDDYVCGETDQLSLFVMGELVLPGTGFAPGASSQVGQQPAALAYSSSGMTLSIPKLGVDVEIVGVPQTPEGWDVTWLEGQAGYLEGTAFPTLSGNTVITSHVWGADNLPGPFYGLDSLQFGDRFSIQAFGSTYTYEVRDTRLVQADDGRPLAHSDYDTVTLLTCEEFNPESGEYQYRRAVNAVLIDVQ